jgi:hypothetical protein
VMWDDVSDSISLVAEDECVSSMHETINPGNSFDLMWFVFRESHVPDGEEFVVKSEVPLCPLHPRPRLRLFVTEA